MQRMLSSSATRKNWRQESAGASWKVNFKLGESLQVVVQPSIHCVSMWYWWGLSLRSLVVKEPHTAVVGATGCYRQLYVSK